ncbi:MAG: sialidase [Proteobacteria bacterium]|nr:sialidase [Pseudomonadota bacterium]
MRYSVAIAAVVLSAGLSGGTAAAAPDTGKPAAEPANAAASIDSGTISGLGARNIGSAAMSGRISALAGFSDEAGKVNLFVGAASGGVWKSIDGATTFKPVFDDQPVQSIGAIAIDPSNHQNIWVGTGESWTRNSVSIGDGVYRSTDGGESWTHVGLPDSERVAKIIVDPRSSDTVYVCVPGKLWSDSAERGLYKTVDGGKTWSLILKGSNLSTGCGSVALDPSNPDVVMAGLWDFRRQGWTFRSGGNGPKAVSGSGLYRSTDAGRTWSEIAPSQHGMPPKPYGRIALAYAPNDAKVVYAFVESTESKLLISHDGGTNWDSGDKSSWMVWRPFYFANLIVDPKNAERVFKTDGALILSEDGGKSFSTIGGFVGMHGDVHDVFIDPNNSQHVFAADDGGLWISYDGANKWWKTDNLPISQFYHVSTDNADPYHVYGGLQDNAAWVGDTAYPGGITSSRWENMYGGDGFWMWSDPSDNNYLYAEAQGGTIGRVNVHTHEIRDIQPKLGPEDLQKFTKLRFNWNTPIALSPNDPATLYIGSQFLFRSRDHGQSWQRISPDLTTNDPRKQKQEQSGGITVDNSAAEMHTTIYSISESPLTAGLIWVGTDDGNLQLTRDAGKHWTNLTANLEGVPKASWVSWVQASAYAAGTAYVALDRHTVGDMAPYVYVTTDFGKTWSPLATPKDSKGIRGYVHVIKEDTKEQRLLFMGTEFGLWISTDAGAHWAQFKGGHIPTVAVRDLAIQPRDNDLILATHGRGMWIVDDITPLRHLTADLVSKEAAFVSARPIQQRIEAQGGWPSGAASFIGENPANGAVITYYQKSRHLFGKLKIEVLDAKGNVVDELPASTRRGLNRVVWTMHLKPPHVPPAVQLAQAGTQGPRALPGTYTVRLEKNGQKYETQVTVGLDRRVTWTAADRQAQFDAAMKVSALFNDESVLFGQIAALREQVADANKDRPATDPVHRRLADFDGKLDGLRKQIVATTEGGAITGEERLREHTDQLYGAIISWDGPPTNYALDNIVALRNQLKDVTDQFAHITSTDLPGVNKALQGKGGKALSVPPPTAFEDDDHEGGAGGVRVGGRNDPDARMGIELPKNLRLWN